MPYYIYRVLPFARLEKITQFVAFKEASSHVKALRTGPGLPADCKVKIIFADNELQAEDLLSRAREREEGVVGDD
jgi:hypothetical protein